MNITEKLFAFFEATMETPKSYGAFHIIFVIIMIACTALLCRFFANASDKAVRVIALVCSILFIVLEVYKQLVFTYDYVDGAVVGDYQWYAFPFQLCSTPIYTLPFVVFLKNGRLRDAFIAYIVAFSIFGGICVYAYPEQVFIETIGINLQTMIHHGMQIVIGVYLAVRFRDRLSFRFYLGGAAVFAALVITALAMNEAVYAYFIEAGIDESFNMFYISRHFDCTLPILSMIYPLVPYPVFLGIYIVGFVLAAAIIFYSTKGIISLVYRLRKKAISNE